MTKNTLEFGSLEQMAKFSKLVTSGFLMNTIHLYLIGNFTEFETALAIEQYGAQIIETSEKVYRYI